MERDPRTSSRETRGWQASEEHPLHGLGHGGWPPKQEILSLECSGDERRFILDRLDEAIEDAGLLASSPQSAESERAQWEREVALLEDVREVQVLENGEPEHR